MAVFPSRSGTSEGGRASSQSDSRVAATEWPGAFLLKRQTKQGQGRRPPARLSSTLPVPGRVQNPAASRIRNQRRDLSLRISRVKSLASARHALSDDVRNTRTTKNQYVCHRDQRRG